MTVQTIIEDAFEQLGEDESLTPYDSNDQFDITSAGAVTLLG